MLIRFHRNVTYKSRVGAPIVVSICRRSEHNAVIEIESGADEEYPILEEKFIHVADDGREFLDIALRGVLCRVWATDAER